MKDYWNFLSTQGPHQAPAKHFNKRQTQCLLIMCGGAGEGKRHDIAWLLQMNGKIVILVGRKWRATVSLGDYALGWRANNMLGKEWVAVAWPHLYALVSLNFMQQAEMSSEQDHENRGRRRRKKEPSIHALYMKGRKTSVSP